MTATYDIRLWEMERRLVVGMFDGYVSRGIISQDLSDQPARAGLEALRRLQQDGLQAPGLDGMLRALAGIGDGSLPLLEQCYPVTRTEFEAAHRFVAGAIIRRRVREAALHIAKKAEQAIPVEELEREVQTALGKALQGCRNSEPRSQVERMERLLDEIAAGATTKGVVETPWPGLNHILGGIEPGNLVLIGARPSMGKSAFALQLAQHIARCHGPVLLASLEMNEREMTRREVAQKVQANSKALAEVDVSRAIAQACPVYLYTENRGVDDLAAMVATFQATHPDMAAVFVDYLGLLQCGGAEQNAESELSYISRSLKRMAERHQVPVFAVHQLNRGVEARVDKRPQLSDLRGSGAIEQDANIVMFLFRPGYYAGRPEDPEAQVRVAKARDGATYTVQLHWKPETVTFHELERRYQDPTWQDDYEEAYP